MPAAIDKKIYKIVILLLILIFLTTFNPKNIELSTKKNFFFKVQNITIINNYLVDKDEVNNKLTHIFDKNILFIKKDDISIPLESVDFLEKIEVKKKYPNDLVIKIFESKPLSIIVKKNKKYILDSSAKLISFDKKNIINNDLPMVFGENAEKNFLNFYNLLKDNDFPKDKIKNYFYFQVDRWDLQLKNNKIIKFPSSKIKDSIKLSIKLLNRQDFINYNVIDLRIHGKIVAE